MKRLALLMAAMTAIGGTGVLRAQARGQHAAHAAACSAPSVRHSGNAALQVPADTEFGFRLFDRIFSRNSDKNVFLSPVSAAITLYMLYGGAHGASAREMATALGLRGQSPQAVQKGAAMLLSALRSADPKVRLEIANAVWARAGVQFKQAFLNEARGYYGARVASLDFHAPTAPATINAWSRCATHGAIPTIVDRIATDIVMYVMNATYFSGDWTTAFDPTQTQSGPFVTGAGQHVQVPFMYLADVSFPYYSGPGFEMLGLPYGTGRFSMLIVLPQAGTSLKSFAPRLTRANWRAWLSHLQTSPTPIALPRFQLKNSWNLNDPLRSLGLISALGPHSDFSGICTRCKLTDVKQKSFLSVDEKGTTAAAVTTGTVRVTAVHRAMAVDHPFFLAIRDSRTGAILFVGAVNNPLG